MKKILSIAVFITAIMLLMPLCALKDVPKSVSASTVLTDTPTNESQTLNYETFRLYTCADEKITEISVDDYIFGVVAAEMPLLYEEEALKAQAVAAYTFACKRKAENTNNTYDISDDPNTNQGFLTEEAARERWGEKADEYIAKLKKVIKDTKGYMITYKNEPITAVYHAISSGKTESCKNVWGTDLPYLKAVVSEGDKLSKDYIKKVTFSKEELKEKMKEKLNLNEFSDISFGEASRTESGTVISIKVCDTDIKGSELRSILNLRSSDFEITQSENNYVFTVYGYGHGVGMSQNGANFMAQQGSNFKEILCHYYSNCKIKKY